MVTTRLCLWAAHLACRHLLRHRRLRVLPLWPGVPPDQGHVLPRLIRAVLVCHGRAIRPVDDCHGTGNRLQLPFVFLCVATCFQSVSNLVPSPCAQRTPESNAHPLFRLQLFDCKCIFDLPDTCVQQTTPVWTMTFVNLVFVGPREWWVFLKDSGSH